MNDLWCSGDGIEILISEVKHHAWLVLGWETIHFIKFSKKLLFLRNFLQYLSKCYPIFGNF